jgi:GMP reductase
MASNMDGVGTFGMAKALQQEQMFTVIGKHNLVDDWKQAIGDGVNMNHISVCLGTSYIWDKEAVDYHTAKKVLEMYPDIKFITVDVANAYHENFGDFIEHLREQYPNKTIIAGNVVTAEMTEELIIRGADVVKVGIGPGSVCTTRTMTGVGVPQLSGIIECADAANGIADGGCVYPGDVAKAFGAGAHFVMLGGMLAGHDESGGEVVDGKITFYGMSSNEAMAKHGRRKDGYRGAEGKTVQIPYRGPVQHTITEILGGVRSSCTYIGAERIKDMPKCATFVRCTQQINTVFGDAR